MMPGVLQRVGSLSIDYSLISLVSINFRSKLSKVSGYFMPSMIWKFSDLVHIHLGRQWVPFYFKAPTCMILISQYRSSYQERGGLENQAP